MAKKTVKGHDRASDARDASLRCTNVNSGGGNMNAHSSVLPGGTASVFMDIREIAELFGTTPEAIHRSRANGNFFPAVRIAGRLLWRRDLIESGLAEQLAQDEVVLADRRRARLAKRARVLRTS